MPSASFECITNVNGERRTASNSLRHNLERFILMKTLGFLICGDYAGDLQAIVNVLNTFGFDQEWDKDERFGW